MLIPLGTDRPLRRPTLINHVLVVLNLALYAVTEGLGHVNEPAWRRLVGALWLNPAEMTWWGLVTYAFVHGGFWHAGGNMVFLWVFGPNVEDRLGRVGYLVFYLLSAVVAGGAHVLLAEGPVVGASGAIAGVTGAYLVLFPHTLVRTMFFLTMSMVAIPAWWLIGGQIVMNLFMQGFGLTGNIAVVAHLAGYAFGVATAMGLLATKLLSREPYDLFTISRQAARRRQFREIRYQQGLAAAQGRSVETPGRRADPVIAKAMEARAEVGRLLAAGEHAAAGAAYRALLEGYGRESPAALLPRRSQYDLANLLFAAGDHATAATAYEVLMAGYPSDHELPRVRLMLGLINARYLNDPVRAKQEIHAAMPSLQEGEHKELAVELLEELG